MRGVIKSTKKGIKDYTVKSANTFTKCFDANSTERWVRIFAAKRWETIKAVQLDDYNNPIPKKFDKVYIDTFVEIILPYIEECKKRKAKKDREEAEKERNKRKRGR